MAHPINWTINGLRSGQMEAFEKNERQTCIPAGSVVNGLGDGARCEV